MNSILDDALGFVDRGYSVTALGADKRAVGQWGHRQVTRATREDVRREFRNPKAVAVGVVMGAVSGGVGVRDYDRPEAFKLWTEDHPGLASELPIVKLNTNPKEQAAKNSQTPSGDSSTA
jgi:hypothetical protein